MSRRLRVLSPTALLLALLTAALLPVAHASAQGTSQAQYKSKRAALAGSRSGAKRALARVRRVQQGRTSGAPSGDDRTLLLRDLALRLPALSGAERTEAEAYLARPTERAADVVRGGYGVPEAAPHCTESFCVHYVTTTNDAPPTEDGNGNGVPDFVETVGQWMQEARQVENGTLQWQAPPPDGGLGGDDRIDVYLKDLCPTVDPTPCKTLGYANADTDASGPSRPAFMVLDDDYTDLGGTNNAKSTVAHEYAHVLQFGIQADADNWLFESTAVWMEERVNPLLNTWVGHLTDPGGWGSFTLLPITTHVPIEDGAAAVKSYGSAVFHHWLTRKYRRDENGDGVENGADRDRDEIVRESWHRAASHPAGVNAAVEGVHDAIVFEAGHGKGSIDDEFAEFAAASAEWQSDKSGFAMASDLWLGRNAENVLTGYPAVKRRTGLTPGGAALTATLDHGSYQLFEVTPRSGTLKLTASVPGGGTQEGARSALALIGRTGDPDVGDVTVEMTKLPNGGTGSVTLADAGRFDRITAAVINADFRSSGFSDADEDWNWDWDDVAAQVTLTHSPARGGDADASFGGSGPVRWPVFEGSNGSVQIPQMDFPGQVLPDPNGGVIMAGVQHSHVYPNRARAKMLRLNGGWAHDPGWGTGADWGVETQLGGTFFQSEECHEGIDALNTDGQGGYIGVGGSGCMSGSGRAYIVRATSTGAYKPGWGVDGQKRIDAHVMSEASDAVVQPDGKIVVAGWMWTGGCGSCGHLRVTRLNADGSMDNSFNGSGVFASGAAATAGPVVLQSNGKIVVGLAETFYTGGPLGLLRLNTDGTLDTSFGNNGVRYAQSSVNGTPYGTRDVVRMPDDSLIIAGGRGVAKFTADGQRDETFGQSGVVNTNLEGTSCAIQVGGIELQPDGKIVVGGTAVESVTGTYPYQCKAPGFSLSRLRADGSLDPTFGLQGRVLGKPAGVGDHSTGISDLVTTPSGALFAIGSYARRTGSSEEIATYRYLTGPSGPKLSVAPAIGGSAVAGDLLTATAGTWSGTTGTTTRYEWLRCPDDEEDSGDDHEVCQPLTGATGSTYRVTPEDVGFRMQVRVTKASSTIENSARSRLTAIVKPRPVAVVTAPTVGGFAGRSQPLTARGTWSGTNVQYLYEWLRCTDATVASCSTIGGDGTGEKTYEPTAGDAGRRLRVRVTASNSENSVTSTSTATAAVTAGEQYLARRRWSAGPEFAQPLVNPAPDASGNPGVWRHMRGPNVPDPAIADFVLLTQHNGSYWYADEPYFTVGVPNGLQFLGIHPSVSSNVIAWTAPLDGVYRIGGTLKDQAGGSWGDGVDWLVIGNTTYLARGTLEPGGAVRELSSGTGGANLGAVALRKGQSVYLVVRPKANNEWDGTDVRLAIESLRPEVAVATPSQGATVFNQPRLTGRASAVAGDGGGVTVKLYWGAYGSGTPVKTITVPRSGTSWSTTVDSPLPAGTYTAVAEQADAAGRVGKSASRTFKVVEPPNASVVAGKLRWFGDPGKVNTVTIAKTSTAVTVADSLAAVRPGSGCTAVTTKKVTCGLAGVTGIEATAGDLDDTVTVTGDLPATLKGEAGNDTLTGGSRDDVLDGGPGGDVLKGGGGADTATYADRSETVMVDLDGVSDDGSAVDGAPGARDNAGVDVENLVGGSAADTLTGSPAANRFDGGKGGDTFAGLEGTDTVTYAGRTDALTVKIDGYRNDGGTEDSATVAYRDNVKTDVENLIGGSADDALTGSAAANVIDGGPGGDRMTGLDGTDTVTYAGRTAAVQVDIDGERDDGGTLDGATVAARDDVELDVENLTGGAAADTLLGSPSANVLDGGRGGDILGGGAGVDTVTYASRTTAVTADIDGVRDDGSAEDSATVGYRDSIRTDVENLTGGSGDDTLTAKLANAVVNVLSGGLGNDTLKTRDGTATADRIFCGGGEDEYDRDGSDAYSLCETAVTLP